ncbi:hypothetical protein RCO48_27065 [Peribacillus frigoritolerans]|nr:hypothetical protein [Peribacillus frigoritolerans]
MEEPIIREKELFKVCIMFPINRKSRKEIKEEKKGPFTLKVNGAVYPYTADQMKLINEKTLYPIR